MSRLEISGLRASVDANEILRGIDLAVEEGQDHLLEGVDHILALEAPRGTRPPPLVPLLEEEPALGSHGRDGGIEERSPRGRELGEVLDPLRQREGPPIGVGAGRGEDLLDRRGECVGGVCHRFSGAPSARSEGPLGREARMRSRDGPRGPTVG